MNCKRNITCQILLKEALDPNRVKNGFRIERSIEETQKFYDEMVAKGRMDPDNIKHLGQKNSKSNFLVFISSK